MTRNYNKEKSVDVFLDVPDGLTTELKKLAKLYRCTESEVLLSIFYRGLKNSGQK